MSLVAYHQTPHSWIEYQGQCTCEIGPLATFILMLIYTEDYTVRSSRRRGESASIKGEMLQWIVFKLYTPGCIDESINSVTEANVALVFPGVPAVNCSEQLFSAPEAPIPFDTLILYDSKLHTFGEEEYIRKILRQTGNAWPCTPFGSDGCRLSRA